MTRKEAITKSTLEHFDKTQDEMVNIMCPGSFGLGPICDNKTRKIIQKEKGIIKITGCRGITCIECWDEEYEEDELMKSHIEAMMISLAFEKIESRAKEILKTATEELKKEMYYNKNSAIETEYAKEDTEKIFTDILEYGKINKSREIVIKISETLFNKNIKTIDKIINLMAVNGIEGEEIFKMAEDNIEKSNRNIKNKTERTIEIYRKTNRSWREIEFEILMEGDIFRLIEPDGNFVIDKKGRKEFTAISNAYKNDDGILTIRVAI